MKTAVDTSCLAEKHINYSNAPIGS